jgi:hypothetical protein
MSARDSVVVNWTIKFSGTPEQVREWILENDPEFLNSLHDVLLGATGTMVSIKNYLDLKKIA